MNHNLNINLFEIGQNVHFAYQKITQVRHLCYIKNNAIMIRSLKLLRFTWIALMRNAANNKIKSNVGGSTADPEDLN